MRQATTALLTILVALSAGGCEEITEQLPHSYISSTYTRNDFSMQLLYRGTTDRALPVRVIGQPFTSVPQIEFAKTIVADMPNGFLNHGTYMLDPGGIAGVGMQVVWNFDPDPRDRPDNICLNHTSGFARRAAPGMATTLHATVALCQEGGAYVANYGGVEATGPDDPRFVDFIKQMTLNTLLSPPTADSSGLGWHIDP